jgi:phosphomannomutase
MSLLNNSTKDEIKFGTDGWRAVISKDFNFDNLTKLACAIALFIKSNERKNIEVYNIDYNNYPNASYKVNYRDYSYGVAVGYDFRFMSELYAKHVAEVLSAFEIPVYLSSYNCSTPALSLATYKNYCAGIMITASHNPYYYNGLKYKAEYGGSSTPEMTKLIEYYLANLTINNNLKPNYNLIKEIDFNSIYLNELLKFIDIERIKNYILKNNILIVIDYMYGVLANSFREIINLEFSIVEINNYRNPYFGGKSPEPIPSNLKELENLVNMMGDNAIGFAFDGDGDRIFAKTKDYWITPHEILPILALHLIKNKKWDGKLVRTMPTSTKLKRIGDHFNTQTIEVPVGFKYIADLFIKENILIGGEESGGIGFKNHIPERDSLLNSLFILEFLSYENIKPNQLINYLHNFTKESYCYRYDYHFESIEQQQEYFNKLKSNIDLLKTILEGEIEVKDYIRVKKDDYNWLMLRPSGTEPLIRIYSEANTFNQAKNLIDSLLNKIK